MNRAMRNIIVGLALVISTFLVLPAPAAAQEPTTGPMADEIRYIEIRSADVAVEDLIAGGHDIRQFSIPSAATRQRVLASAALKPVEGAGNFWNLMLNSVPRADGKLNPMAIREIREAMNLLIDREFILSEVYFGFGIPHTSLFYALEPEYARHAAFIAGVEAQYGYNPAKARTTINTAMTAAGATLVSGKWQHGGGPVTINFIIRVDDPRRTAWGGYVAGLLEGEGFTVTRDFKTSAAASPIVYANPTQDDGRWQAYTEGWGSSGLTLWDIFRGYQMFRWNAFSTIWDFRSIDAVTAKAIDDWFLGNFTSEAQRAEMVRTAIAGTIKDSTRVWLVAEDTMYVTRKEIDAVYDLQASLDTLFGARSARRNNAPGGVITISQPVGFVGGWNPIGITWAYDQAIENEYRDPGVFVHPHSGAYIPVRCSFDVTTADAGQTLDVPDDAIRWNMATKTWETVAATATARSKTVFTANFGKWQHGQPINMYDILNHVSAAYRLADPAGDAYSSVHVGDFTIFLSNFKGLKVVGNIATSNQVEVYMDYWHWDTREVAAVSDIWSTTPWELEEVMLDSAVKGQLAFKEEDSTAARPWMNQAFGPSIAKLDASYAAKVGTVPMGFTGLPSAPSPADVTARWDALATWRAGKGHYMVSNGPYYVESVDTATLTTILKADRANYPLTPRAWDGLLQPRIPEVTLGAAPTINIDVGAVFSIDVNLFGQPYDDATLSFIVLDPVQGKLLFEGVPVRVGPGRFEARLTAEQTQTLKPGAYELRVIGVSADAAIPTIVRQSFLAFTVAGVLETLIKATEAALKTDIGTLRNQVNTIDASTTALASDIAAVSSLVLVVLVLAVLAIASSVVSILVMVRRLPSRMRPPMMETEPKM